MRPARVAIYYAPAARRPPDPPELRLARPRPGHQRAGAAARRWTASPKSPPNPALYGFHATLKPPMRLAEGTAWTRLHGRGPRQSPRTSRRSTCRRWRYPICTASWRCGKPPPCPPLQALADACVEQLDSFRAPPSDDELARRRKATLSAEQDAMLVRWGYPYVFGTWFFHMTLTRRLSEAEKAVILPAAEAWFAPALAIPRRVEDICLFTQAAPGAAFTLAERIKLRG